MLRSTTMSATRRMVDGDARADVDDAFGPAADEREVGLGDVAHVEIVPYDVEVAGSQRSAPARLRS